MNILVFNRQYLSGLSFIQNIRDKVGLEIVQIPLWVVTYTVLFEISRPMFQCVAKYYGTILFFCCDVAIDKIWDIFKFLCSAMHNPLYTSVLEISTNAQLMVEPCSMRLSALLYYESLLDLSSDSLVLVLTLAIHLGRCLSSEFNSCP